MKKLTVNRLALGSLRARRRQYLLMITGIILAMTFAVSIALLLVCMDASNKADRKARYGNSDLLILDCGDIDFAEMQAQGKITEYAFANVLGYGYTDPEDKSNGTAIAFFDDAAIPLAYPAFIEGGMPQKAGEIAIERSALIALGLSGAKVGDTITLTVEDVDGANAAEKSYLLTGIMRDKRKNLINSMRNSFDTEHYPSAVVNASEYDPSTQKLHRVCYANASAGFLRYQTMLEFFDSYGIEVGEWNSSDFYGFYGDNTPYLLRTVLLCVFAAVLALISCIGIINSFSSNLAERRKQIGMMRAVGATRRQIIRIYGREALVISLICAPASILLSIGAVFAVTKAVGDGFIFTLNVPIMLLGALLGIACVMGAALVPLVRASKITPVQAIRDIDMTRKMKRLKLKNKLSFDPSKLIARRNLIFRKGRFVLVSTLLALSVVLICCAFNFMRYVLSDYDYIETMPDYSMSRSGGTVWSHYVNYPLLENESSFSNEVRRKVEATPYIGKVTGAKYGKIIIPLSGESDYAKLLKARTVFDTDRYFAAEEAAETLEQLKNTVKSGNIAENDKYKNHREYYSLSGDYAEAVVHSYDTSEIKSLFAPLVIEGSINTDKLLSGEEIILYVPQRIGVKTEYKTDSHGASWTYPFINLDISPEEEDGCDLVTKQDYFHVGDEIELTVASCDRMPETQDSLFDGVSINDAEAFDHPEGMTVTKKKVRIGAIVSNYRSGDRYTVWTYSALPIVAITVHQAADALIPNLPYSDLNLNVQDGVQITQEIDDDIMSGLENAAINVIEPRIYSKFRDDLENTQAYRGVFFAMLAVIMLIFTAVASLINNFLTAQVRESKQKVGTLRTVGASKSVLTGSFIYQLIAMTGTGAAIGYAVYLLGYLLLTAILHSMNSTGLSEITEHFGAPQLWQAAIFCAVLFAVCSVNLYSKVSRLMKYSIVENIREL